MYYRSCFIFVRSEQISIILIQPGGCKQFININRYTLSFGHVNTAEFSVYPILKTAADSKGTVIEFNLVQNSKMLSKKMPENVNKPAQDREM